MPKNRKYVRAKDGRFGTVAGASKSKSKSKSKKKAVAKKAVARGPGGKKLSARAASRSKSQRALAATIRARRPGKGTKVSNKAIRKERNQQALDALRKSGIKIPKGSIKLVADLKKGDSVTLSNGLVISRSKTNRYSTSRPKSKRKGALRKVKSLRSRNGFGR